MVLVTQCQRVEKALIDGPGAAVSVRVVRATGLLAADKGGTSDPFVTVLSKGSKKAKTSVKKKTLEPEWDETLDLTVHDLAAPLSLTVFDHDKGAKNDNLGSAEITGLSEIEPGVPTPYKVALSKQGAVEVVVTLEYRVSVHVVRAKDLLAADKNGKSDPYVVVQSAGGKKAKTSVKKKTLEPEWDETLELSVLDAAAPLSFAVWDHDKIGTNDALGAGEVLLGECAPGAPTPLRVALSTQGTIEVVVTFSPAEPADEPEELAAGAAGAVGGAAAAAAAASASGAPVSGARAAREKAMAREKATPQVVPTVASGVAAQLSAPLGDAASRLKRLVAGGGSSEGHAAASSPAHAGGFAQAGCQAV